LGNNGSNFGRNFNYQTPYSFYKDAGGQVGRQALARPGSQASTIYNAKEARWCT